MWHEHWLESRRHGNKHYILIWNFIQDARNGKTALQLATENGCLEIVEILTAYATSPGLASYSGIVPSELAQASRSGSRDLLEHYYS